VRDETVVDVVVADTLLLLAETGVATAAAHWTEEQRCLLLTDMAAFGTAADVVVDAIYGVHVPRVAWVRA
jgi:hypothetical protein